MFAHTIYTPHHDDDGDEACEHDKGLESIRPDYCLNPTLHRQTNGEIEVRRKIKTASQITQPNMGLID